MKKQITILCIDDEENILKTLKRMLESQGYRVLTALNGKNGIEILKNVNSIDIVICDRIMPGIRGNQVLGFIQNNFPHIIRIMLSAFSDFNDIPKIGPDSQINYLLDKPWDTNKILKIIHNSLKWNP